MKKLLILVCANKDSASAYNLSQLKEITSGVCRIRPIRKPIKPLDFARGLALYLSLLGWIKSRRALTLFLFFD